MDVQLFEQLAPTTWRISPHGKMNAPGIIYATADLIHDMDNKVYEQLCNVCQLPGVVGSVYAMPDAHWGYGFPIGGIAAFDPLNGGVVSAGGVGFDISCGVRLLHTGLKTQDLLPHKEALADILFKRIPSGVGSRSEIRLSEKEMNAMLTEGARWAVRSGYGELGDLDYTEERGHMEGAIPEAISDRAKERQRPEMGTLGSGNHYLEVQEVTKIFYPVAAQAFGLHLGDIVVSIHCGSRGLGHQIGTEYLRLMATHTKDYGLALPDRELACAPIDSEVGRAYLGAMRGATNCALANRQIITHFTRLAFSKIFTTTQLNLVYDVSHNTCKSEWHTVNGERRRLFVHRKGATRALGPGHTELPEKYKAVGQPVIIGGSMGVGSYVLVGTQECEGLAFSSACHGAGRAMSRTHAMKKWSGPQVIEKLKQQGILIRSGTYRGVAEEAPDAYKNLDAVVNAAETARLALKVAQLSPHVCIKG